MVPISLASIVPSHVGNAIDHAVCRAAPSKTQRPSVEAGILPSLAGVVLFRNISPQTASPVPPKTSVTNNAALLRSPCRQLAVSRTAAEVIVGFSQRNLDHSSFYSDLSA